MCGPKCVCAHTHIHTHTININSIHYSSGCNAVLFFREDSVSQDAIISLAEPDFVRMPFRFNFLSNAGVAKVVVSPGAQRTETAPVFTRTKTHCLHVGIFVRSLL